MIAADEAAMVFPEYTYFRILEWLGVEVSVVKPENMLPCKLKRFIREHEATFRQS